MRIRTNRLFCRAALALMAALATATAAGAQRRQTDSAAAQTAHALVQAKQKTVMVFDFTGPGEQVTELGRRLADELSAGMAVAEPQLRAEQRAPEIIRKKAGYYVPEIVLDPEATIILARDLEVKAFVTGELSVVQDALVVKVASYSSDHGKGIKAMQISWPLTPETKDLLDKTVAQAAPPKAAPAQNSKASETGHKPPSCGYCPKAPYTTAATDAKLQGIVELEAKIDENGIIQDLWVIKGLPDGLTAMAITTIGKWKLMPATGPDGKPEKVFQMIEVTFQLY
jgi:Gram-negative bacterial TonB protein C-terminal